MLIVTAIDFGKLIKETRKKAGLTQEEVAAASGIGPRFISELENGKPSCQLEKALLVAQLLGIKLDGKTPALD